MRVVLRELRIIDQRAAADHQLASAARDDDDVGKLAIRYLS